MEQCNYIEQFEPQDVVRCEQQIVIEVTDFDEKTRVTRFEGTAKRVLGLFVLTGIQPAFRLRKRGEDRVEEWKDWILIRRVKETGGDFQLTEDLYITQREVLWGQKVGTIKCNQEQA